MLTSSAGLIQSPVAGRAATELNTLSIPDICRDDDNGEFSSYCRSIVCATALACAVGTTATAMAVHEIDTTSGLFRRALEVYLRQNGENDFEKFRLQYDGATQTIDVSLWNYQNLTQPTHAQLIALLTQAKRYLTRLTEHDKRREKDKRRANIPPAVHIQVGTSYTGTGLWGAAPVREKGGTTSTSITSETGGLHRILMSGK